MRRIERLFTDIKELDGTVASLKYAFSQEFDNVADEYDVKITAHFYEDKPAFSVWESLSAHQNKTAYKSHIFTIDCNIADDVAMEIKEKIITIYEEG
jgi:hypothetical protein